MLYLILCAVFSYLLGSISPSIIISKMLFGEDIRKTGSGNAGASNTVRVFGKKAGLLVFLLDFAKGFVAVMIARIIVVYFGGVYICIPVAGFFAQLGHIFPIFFGFKGGKGVATAVGSAMAVMPTVAVILLILFIIILVSSKTVALASGICAALYPLLAYFLSDENKTVHLIFAACCSAIIIIKHLDNFVRLLDGSEPKLSFGKKRE